MVGDERIAHEGNQQLNIARMAKACVYAVRDQDARIAIRRNFRKSQENLDGEMFLKRETHCSG